MKNKKEMLKDGKIIQYSLENIKVQDYIEIQLLNGKKVIITATVNGRLKVNDLS